MTVADGMVAVTSVMRAHQILLARVETALRPYGLSFSRYELLRLLAFSSTGALPITKASDRLQVHVTSVTHAIRRLEADGLVERLPHPTDGRTTLVQMTELGRSTVEDATVTLNDEVFADIGISDAESRALADVDRDAAPQCRRLLARGGPRVARSRIHPIAALASLSAIVLSAPSRGSGWSR